MSELVLGALWLISMVAAYGLQEGQARVRGKNGRVLEAQIFRLAKGQHFGSETTFIS